MRPTPKWLAEKIAEGARKAHPATCSECGTQVIAGLDSDRAALMVMVDAAPVTQLGELRALMAGGSSFYLDGNQELQVRTGHRMIRHPLHLEHRCPGGTA